MRDGALIRTLAGHGGTVWSVAYSPDGQRIASGGEDNFVKIWRASDGALVRTLPSPNEAVVGIAFSPESRFLASGGRARGAIGTMWHQLTGGRLSGENDVSVGLWRVRDGALQQGLAGHSDDVWSVAFSPDGKWLATSSEDKTVGLWRLAATSAR